MAENIGYATLNVVPSSKGFGKTLQGQVAGPLANAGRVGGKGLMGGLGKSVAKLGGMIGVAVAGFAGIKSVIGGGISRQLQIEDATAKLDGLGHSSKNVEKIMDNALASVKGTAFGLGDAATVAASSVAAGVKPGKDLQRTLSLVGDAATIAGVGMGEMGAIFNKAAASNKVQMDVINQLHDQGVPALSLLAKEMGVTAEEASKMASAGKIDFATFQNAMEAGMGGAALKSGETTRGAFANMQAALGRLGETFTGPVFAGAKGFFNLITASVDALNTVVKPVFDAMTKSIGGGMNDAFARASKAVTDFTPVLQGVVQLLSGGGYDADLFGKMANPAVLTFLNGVREAFLTISDAIKTGDWTQVGSLIEQGLSGFNAIREKVLTGIVEMLPGIVTAVTSMLPGIVNGFVTLFTGLAQAVATVLPLLVEAITAAVPVIIEALVAAVPILLGGAVTMFTSLVTALTTVLPQLITAILGMVPSIIATLTTLIPTLIQGAIQLFMALVQAIPLIIPPLISALTTAIPQIISALLGMVPVLIQGAVDLFTALVTAIPQIIPPLITAVLDLIPVVIKSLLSMLPVLIQGAVSLFTGIVKAIPKVLPQLITAVIGLIPKIVSTLIGLIPTLLSAAVQLFMAIVKAIPQIVGAVLGALRDLGASMIDAVMSIGPRMFEAGKNIITGIIDGIKSLAGTIGNAFLNMLPGWIVGPFKAALGIHSPSRVFAGFGKNIGQGLIKGLVNTQASVKTTTAKLAEQVKKAFDDVASKREKAQKKIETLNGRLISAQDSLKSAQDRVRAAQSRYNKAVADGNKGNKAAIDSAKRSVAAARRRIASIVKERAEQKKLVKDSDKFLKQKNNGALEKSILSTISKVNKRLSVLAKQRDTVTEKLKAAQKKLTDAVKVRDDFAKSVSGGIFGQFDLSETYGTDHAITALRAQLTTAKAAKSTFDKLKKLGLNNDGYQQLVEAFASTGDIGPAKAILAGGKSAIKTVNSLQKQLKSVASSMGTQASRVLYQSGVNAANGLVKGLQSQKKKLTGLMTDIAESLTRAVKKKLKIHSPSRVFRDIGAFTGEGMAVGLESSASRIERASRALQPAAPTVPNGGLIGAQERTAQAVARAGTPLVGNLTLQSHGDVRDDLDEVNFRLRRISRGGLYAA